MANKTKTLQQKIFIPPAGMINAAEMCTATQSLGPGLRSVLWVQGCPFHCPGCIAPDWTRRVENKLITVEAAVEALLVNADVSGITFSGGEPMLQASALAAVAQAAKKRRKVNILCFTGFELEQLQQRPPEPGVADLLNVLDVLIDGQYMRALNDNKGMRGSRNQKIHFLTDKLSQFDFENQPRSTEIQILDGKALLVGVPHQQTLQAFETALAKFNSLSLRLVDHERS